MRIISVMAVACALWLLPLVGEAQDGFGGARTNGLVRDQVAAGMVPSMEAFTVEGMLAEHHFPVQERRCVRSFCVFTAMGHGLHRPTLTRSTYLLVEPVSGTDPDQLVRAPQNVSLVIDRSGSMTGWKLAAALRAAHAIVDHLGPGDRLSIVSFDDVAEVHAASAHVLDRQALHRDVDTVVVRGGTNLHAGLVAGFAELARHRRPGTADRLFVLTDEQPNVGVTDTESFMALVGENARRGVGISVIGVGLDLGADLANAMSRLEGGSYHYLEGPEGVPALFGDGFDAMLTPVAYGLSVTIRPGPGLRVADIFGVPSDDYVLGSDGSATLRASTVFLDRRRSGAIVRLEPTGSTDAVTRATAHVDSRWVRASDGTHMRASQEVRYLATEPRATAEFASPHHYRAYALANFAQLLRASLWHWHRGHRTEALRIMTNARRALDADAKTISDAQLARERELADGILTEMGHGSRG